MLRAFQILAFAMAVCTIPSLAMAQATPIQGTGISGTPAGGVLTVQGPEGGGGSAVTIEPSSAASVGIAPVVAGAAVSNSVLKASPGNFYGAYALCTSACWLQIFNSATLPSNGATTSGIAAGNLQDCIPIAAGGYGSISYNPGPPEVFSTGITAAISSTNCGSLTASMVGFIHGSVQ